MQSYIQSLFLGFPACMFFPLTRYVAAACAVADADEDEQILSGMMSPPSGYSSGEEDTDNLPYANAEILSAMQQEVERLKQQEAKAAAAAKAGGKEGGQPQAGAPQQQQQQQEEEGLHPARALVNGAAGGSSGSGEGGAAAVDESSDLGSDVDSLTLDELPTPSEVAAAIAEGLGHPNHHEPPPPVHEGDITSGSAGPLKAAMKAGKGKSRLGPAARKLDMGESESGVEAHPPSKLEGMLLDSTYSMVDRNKSPAEYESILEEQKRSEELQQQQQKRQQEEEEQQKRELEQQQEAVNLAGGGSAALTSSADGNSPKMTFIGNALKAKGVAFDPAASYSIDEVDLVSTSKAPSSAAAVPQPQDSAASSSKAATDRCVRSLDASGMEVGGEASPSTQMAVPVSQKAAPLHVGDGEGGSIPEVRGFSPAKGPAYVPGNASGADADSSSSSSSTSISGRSRSPGRAGGMAKGKGSMLSSALREQREQGGATTAAGAAAEVEEEEEDTATSPAKGASRSVAGGGGAVRGNGVVAGSALESFGSTTDMLLVEAEEAAAAAKQGTAAAAVNAKQERTAAAEEADRVEVVIPQSPTSSSPVATAAAIPVPARSPIRDEPFAVSSPGVLGTSPMEGYYGVGPSGGLEGTSPSAGVLAAGAGHLALGLQGFAVSACGHLLAPGLSSVEAQQLFEAHKLTAAGWGECWRELLGVGGGEGQQQQPQPQEKLVVRIGGVLYSWQQAAPMVIGFLAFGGKWDHLVVSQEGEGPLPMRLAMEREPGSAKKVRLMGLGA